MLILESIDKAFADHPVLQIISLAVETGELVVLLGPSGCGKTTLLRIIAGLERPDNGRLFLHNRDLAQIPVHRRGFGMVFQDYALFPHKNVFENVAFGLRMLEWERPRIVERVDQVLGLVGLAGFDERPIYDLSGGEQQRVALARALAPAPRLLLLDEPLGALDRALRERLMLDLRAIIKQAGGIVGRPEGITAIYVTHDQAEAFAVADRVVVLNEGRIEQIGRPTDLYRRPETPFVARFLGMDNLIAGQVVAVEPPLVRTALGDWTFPDEVENGRQWAPGRSVTLLIRPDAGRLPAVDEEAPVQFIAGKLQSLSFRGRYRLATIVTPSLAQPLKFEFDTAVPLPPPGSGIRVVIDTRKVQLLVTG